MNDQGNATDLVNALGTLVINFASLEESLHDAIRVLCDPDNSMIDVLTAGLAFRTLVEKLGALCVELKTARVPLEEVRAFCNALGNLNDERNTMIHGAWNVRAGGHAPRRFKRTAKIKTGFRLEVIETTPVVVLALAERCAQAERRLWEIVGWPG